MICSFAVLYNYSLHRNFWPDAEYAIRAYHLLLNDYANIPNVLPLNSVYGVLDYIIYYINGFNIQSLRIEATLTYGIIILLSIFPALYSRNTCKINFYLIPFFIFLLIIINPGSSYYCGSHAEGFHMYPYDMHTQSTILSLLGINFLVLYEKSKGKAKKILLIPIVILAVVGYKYSDMIFVLAFSLPLMVYFLYWKKIREKLTREKVKQYVAYLMFICFGFISIMRLISLVTDNNLLLFSDRSDSGFADTTEIYKNFFVVATELLALFNVELTGKSVLNLSNIVIVLRVVVVIIFLLSIGRNIRGMIKKESFEKIKIADFVMSVGSILIILFLLITNYGSYVRCIRYMIPILFYATILLSRDIDIKCEGIDSNRIKQALIVLFATAILINFKPFWYMDSYKDAYEEPLYEISKYVEENNLGNGGASYWAAPILTALMNGDNIVISGIPRTDRYASENYYSRITKIYWVVDSPIHPQEGVEYLGEPTSTYSYGDYTLYYFEDGISVTAE